MDDSASDGDQIITLLEHVDWRKSGATSRHVFEPITLALLIKCPLELQKRVERVPNPSSHDIPLLFAGAKVCGFDDCHGSPTITLSPINPITGGNGYLIFDGEALARQCLHE